MNKEEILETYSMSIEEERDYFKGLYIELRERINELENKLNKIKEWVINMDKRDVNATYNYEKLIMLANVSIGDSNDTNR